jgi:hypothetical protein
MGVVKFNRTYCFLRKTHEDSTCFDCGLSGRLVWSGPSQVDPLHVRSWAASCAACHGTDGRAQPGMISLAGVLKKSPFRKCWTTKLVACQRPPSCISSPRAIPTIKSPPLLATLPPRRNKEKLPCNVVIFYKQAPLWVPWDWFLVVPPWVVVVAPKWWSSAGVTRAATAAKYLAHVV